MINASVILRKSIGVSVAGIALSGCATYEWRQAYATDADFARDDYQCELIAAQNVPTAMTTLGAPGGSTTNCTAFGASANCTTTPTPNFLGNIPIDLNGGERDDLHDRCMVARGYRKVRL